MRPNPSCGLNIHFLVVVAILLTLAPPPGAAQDVRTLCVPLEIREGFPEEKPCLNPAVLGTVAKRDGRVLTLKLANEKTKVVSDANPCEDPDPTKEGECVTHRLVGYIGDRQFIVHVGPYECPFVLLVNRRTGEEMTLEDWPNLSPNKKRFVVVASTADGECSPKYAVAIFSLASDPPRLEWQFTPDNANEDYRFDGWDGDNRVRLRASVGSVVGKQKQMATDLKLTAQGWQIKRPNGEYSLGVPGQANPQRPASQPANAAAPAAPPGR
ncbi:MAG TPA: hypothetical protein VKC66_03070 [Xanthobacteraceae bacterium]|nr:hypothetical protein [Xanthobacteraceae bacterium]